MVTASLGGAALTDMLILIGTVRGSFLCFSSHGQLVVDGVGDDGMIARFFRLAGVRGDWFGFGSRRKGRGKGSIGVARWCR